MVTVNCTVVATAARAFNGFTATALPYETRLGKYVKYIVGSDFPRETDRSKAVPRTYNTIRRLPIPCFLGRSLLLTPCSFLAPLTSFAAPPHPMHTPSPPCPSFYSVAPQTAPSGPTTRRHPPPLLGHPTAASRASMQSFILVGCSSLFRCWILG